MRFLQNFVVRLKNLSRKRDPNVFRPKINWGKMSGMTSLFKKMTVMLSKSQNSKFENDSISSTSLN